MNMKRKNLLVFFTLIIFILAGCKNEEETKTSSSSEQSAKMTEEKKKEDESIKTIVQSDVPPFPRTIEDVVKYPIGQYASDENQIEKPEVQQTLESFPVLSENATDTEIKEYFAQIYSLFKLDYLDPGTIIQEFDIVTSDEYGPSENYLQVEQYNVEIILDSSGSMANKIGSKTRMDLAKEAIRSFASSLPNGANVALRVYGHKGTGAESDKQNSCTANELIYPLQTYNSEKLNNSLNQFKPAGWTPLAESMMKAIDDFQQVDQTNSRNVIYIVSDGIETCDGNPVEAAKQLKQSGLAPVVNIIGFELDSKGQAQLKEVAEAADGTYVNVQNQEELKKQFEAGKEEIFKWYQWRQKSKFDLLRFTQEQQKRILNLKNEWIRIINAEKRNVYFATNHLYKAKKITNDHKEVIEDVYNEFYNSLKDKITEISDNLWKVTEDNYEEQKQLINEIYESSDLAI